MTNSMRSDAKAKMDSGDPTSVMGRWSLDPETGLLSTNPAVATSGVRMMSSGPSGAVAHIALPVGVAVASSAMEYDMDAMLQWRSIDNADGKGDMRRAAFYWRKDPVAYSCIELLVALSNQRLVVSSANRQAERVIGGWLGTTMGHNFRKMWFQELFRSSMVPVLKTLIPYSPRRYNPDKIPRNGQGNVDGRVPSIAQGSSRVREHSQSLSDISHGAQKAYLEAAKAFYEGLSVSQESMNATMEAQSEWRSKAVPGAYTILNPLNIDIPGPESVSWLRDPMMVIDDQLRRAVMEPSPTQSRILAQMPFELVEAIRRKARLAWVSPNVLSVSYGNKQPYERYPTPPLAHCFDFLALKAEMIAMDKATVQCVKNKILKVTIGNDIKWAEPPHLDALARIFKNPGNHMTLFWDHTLQMEWVEPKFESVTKAKYDLVDDQIRNGLGVSGVMTGGEGSSIGNNTIHFKGIMARVIDAQNNFLEMVNGEVEMVRQSLQISAAVGVRFDNGWSEDASSFRNSVLQMVNTGVIDPLTAAVTLGENVDVLKSRHRESVKLREEGMFLPSNGLGGGMVPPSPSGGKPKDDPAAMNNRNKVGTSQPKAVARLVSGPDGTALVYEGDISPDQVADLQHAFGGIASVVMPRSEYDAAKLKAAASPPTADPLSEAEIMASAIKGVDAVSAAAQEFEARVERHRSQGEGRGRYATKAIKDRIMAEVIADAIAGLNPGMPAEEWTAATSHLNSLQVRDALCGASLLAARNRKANIQP